MLIGGGVLGGLRCARSGRDPDTGEVVEGRPLATQALVDEADSHPSPRSTAGTLAYLHAGLRWSGASRAGRRSAIGPGTRVFAEAGGGLLAALPGGGDAGAGTSAGLHIAGGVISAGRARTRSP
jgi:hypothetical protein